MSKIDYQALREKAEKATWGDWDSYKPHRGARGYEVRLSSQAIAQHVLKNNAEFIAAFNPKVALALLDEREAQNKRIAELEACRAALAAEHGIQIAINELLALAPRLDKRAVDALSVAVEHLCKLIKKEAVSEQN
ncbi:ead/Ea22-like family protein [Escherichia coli]|uniref:ead/Ea22-like family protein n=1 Tax=Escherichia coli TaxID=562 RepID=UPI000BE24CBA|nr:ead/Ea22-like family protein [Escherichia coli]